MGKMVYQMHIVNSDNRDKIVIVSGHTHADAIDNMKKQYGHEWTVFTSKLLSVEF